MTQQKDESGRHDRPSLVVKKILDISMRYSPEEEVIYRDRVRLSYRDLNERINRLANVLAELGVERGDSVAVFEYDSHRYLECFFAIPMMGAVLQPVNYMLLPEQIIYALNHSGTKIVVVNSELLPLLEGLKNRLKTVPRIILIAEDGGKYENGHFDAVEYEEMLERASPVHNFSDINENTKAVIFYDPEITGLPETIYLTHKQVVLYVFAVMTILSSSHNIGRFKSVNDVYMPLTPMFHVYACCLPYAATLLGMKQVYPGKYEPWMILRLIMDEGGIISSCDPSVVKKLIAETGDDIDNDVKRKVNMEKSHSPNGSPEAAMKLKIHIFTKLRQKATYPLFVSQNFQGIHGGRE